MERAGGHEGPAREARGKEGGKDGRPRGGRRGAAQGALDPAKRLFAVEALDLVAEE